MVAFTHTIACAQGLHARPVALTCRCAMDHESTVVLRARGLEAEARDMIAVMALDARCGDVLEVTVEGPDEEETAAAFKALFAEVL